MFRDFLDHWPEATYVLTDHDLVMLSLWENIEILMEPAGTFTSEP